MSLRVRVLIVVLSLSGCGGDKEKVESQREVVAPAPAPVEPPPARVVFGDCAPATLGFVSGPRPQPFAATAAGIGDAGGRPTYEPRPGWGTMGKGRYGTISQDSGTGSGYGGVSSRRKSIAPQIRIGPPEVYGALDKAIIRRYIRRKQGQIKYCYEKQLLAKPGLAGKVVAQFIISADGKVIEAKVEGLDDEVDACIRDRLMAIEFPKPQGGGMIKVRYPFVFSPGAYSKPIAIAPSTKAEPPPAPASPAVDVDYRAGEANPLREHAAALGTCFAHQSGVAWSTALVDVTADPAGAVTDARVVGVSDSAAACIAAEARKATFPAGVTTRCALSFGDEPIDELPSVSITAADVTMGDTRLASVPAIAGDKASGLRIGELFAHAEHVRGDREHAAAPLTDAPPFVIRATDDAPMKAVYAALYSVRDAGVDVLLARAAGDRWAVVAGGGTAPTFPLVPVPAGTGVGWTRIQNASVKVFGADRPPQTPELGILVRAHDVVVGVSRLQIVDAYPDRDGHPDWAAVAARLKEHRASRGFEGRSRVQIAADGDAPYGRYVEAIEQARAAGFGDWMVTLPSGLSARVDP